MKRIEKHIELLDQILTNVKVQENKVSRLKGNISKFKNTNYQSLDDFYSESYYTFDIDSSLLYKHRLHELEISERALDWWKRRYTRVLGDLYSLSIKVFNEPKKVQ